MSADKLLIFGKGFQYSRDGTGNRLVFHLQGCDLLLSLVRESRGNIARTGASAKGKRHSRMGLQEFRPLKCRSCADRTCLKPNGILVLSSREYTVDELCREAVSAKPMMYDGGGVTLTGGEVCVQAEPSRSASRSTS